MHERRKMKMKKRILCISLAFALFLMALAPATALAYNDQRVPTGNFTGSGLIYITYMPDPTIKGPIWRYQGEIVEGFLDQCDWDLLAGTVFWSEHDSIVRVSDDGNARGMMKGTFTLTRPDGTGTLEGTFNGRIRGNLFTGDITDEGTWRATKGTGVYEDVKTWGNWSAELHLGVIPGTDIYTLVGPVNWNGRYIGLTKPEAITKPWQPIKPWSPIKPGKPIKPWQPIKPEKP
jgi:hypothetical protein